MKVKWKQAKPATRQVNNQTTKQVNKQKESKAIVGYLGQPHERMRR